MALRINKNAMNMAYGLGASIVIIGALMKIIHQDLGPISGNLMLTIGLITEALILTLIEIMLIIKDTTHKQVVLYFTVT